MPKIVEFIGYKKLVPEAQAPYQKYITDAGYDLSAVSIEETNDYIEYRTGIALEIPIGMVGLVFPRSSVTGKDLMLKNCVGVIDATYRGEIRCRFAKVVNQLICNGEITDSSSLFKKGNKHKIIDIMLYPPGPIKIYEVGDRICQIVFLTLPQLKLIEKQELSETERGPQGFGSTGLAGK
jgi:dUTP pyrophosphatase